jgi:hypothetical protein
MAQLSLKPPMSFSSSTTTVGPLPPDLFGASSAHALATVAPSNPSSVAQNNSSSADRQRSTDDRKHVADSFADEMLEWLDKKMSSI